MNVLHLSHSDIDGGAAIAAYRLHQALREKNIRSTLQVAQKRTLDFSVLSAETNTEKGFILLRKYFNETPLKFYPERNQNSLFSPQYLPDNLLTTIQKSNPDIINLHWVCKGFLKIETLARLNTPLIWKAKQV